MLSPSCAGSLDAPRSPFLLISEGILLLIGEFCDLTFSRAVGGISRILLINSLWLSALLNFVVSSWRLR